MKGGPFSAGVIAAQGLDLVHVTLERPLPLDSGLSLAKRYVDAVGRPTSAIAGFELRIHEPMTPDSFDSFNRHYVEKLSDLGFVVDGIVPTARTNVAPLAVGISEPSLYGLAYTVPTRRSDAAFLLSGVAEARQGDYATMLDSIMDVLSSRMSELGASWDDATAIQLYGVEQVQSLVVNRVLTRVGRSASRGIRWFPSLPPVIGLNFEIDVRSAGTEIFLKAE